MRLTAFLCAILVSLAAFARLVPHKDPLDGVLDAELVVIVSPSPSGQPGLFKIEEVLLGDLHVGDSLDLGDFKLSITQESGPPILEVISPTTRVLLFLQRVTDSRSLWEPTYFGESYFWVQRPEDVALLRRAAERAVDLRTQWENATHIPDQKQRVAALWPFLSLRSYGVSFLKHTHAELQKTAPTAGEYFADHFDEMSHDERMLLLPEAGAYGSKKLHDRLIRDLAEQQHHYETYVASLGTVPRAVDWNTMPKDVQDASGEIYYGLAGLVEFHDRNDLPLIRATALWSAKYHQEQTAEAALQGFRRIPDPANLAAIESILKEFLPGRKPGMWSVDWEAERALCQHRYPETVLLLAPFVAESDNNLATESESCLADIVGLDLGRNPKSWIDWYGATHKPHSLPPSAHGYY
jgi:hypothetical protein